MKSKIVYKEDKTYGIHSSGELYAGEIASDRNENVELKFKFPALAKGVGENSKILSMTLTFTIEEAEEICAVLHSFLSDPKDKNRKKRWISFREMPKIYDKKTLEKINVEFGEKLSRTDINIVNNSIQHISSVKCVITRSHLKNSLIKFTDGTT